MEEKKLKQLYSRKKYSIKKHPPKKGSYWTFDDFKKWYSDQYSKEPVCYYCGIPEKFIKRVYWDIRGTKRPATRIRLELERLDPCGNYNSENVVLACFNCNNCKSDIFTHNEFKAIGKTIEKIWKEIVEENNIK